MFITVNKIPLQDNIYISYNRAVFFIETKRNCLAITKNNSSTKSVRIFPLGDALWLVFVFV